MSNLSTGDRVLAVDRNGAPLYATVIGFLHRDVDRLVSFLTLWTDDDQKLTITSDHLVYSVREADRTLTGSGPVFAGHVQPGEYLFKREGPREEDGRAVKVVRRSYDVMRGVFAPLTTEGTIVVDETVTSCYASLGSHWLAHVAMAPLRLANYVIGSRDEMSTPPSGVHWYATFLLRYAKTVLPDEIWFES